MLEYVGAMERICISVILALVLVLVVTSPVTAAKQHSVEAQVTVSTLINFTIVDYGDAGLKFGSLIPGSKNNPETAQKEETGAILLRLGADSNTDCVISTRAGDFVSGSDKLLVNNVTWNIAQETGGASTMKDSYSVINTLEPGQSQGIWHWLNVPSNQVPGIYSASFYYQAAKVS